MELSESDAETCYQDAIRIGVTISRGRQRDTERNGPAWEAPATPAPAAQRPTLSSPSVSY